MATDDCLRARLDQMIDMGHRLAVLDTHMPWTQIEASLGTSFFPHRSRPGRVVTDDDLFGTVGELVGARVSNASRPRLPIRMMVALLYLKHADNDSYVSVVQRWALDVHFQFFCGQVYCEPGLP